MLEILSHLFSTVCGQNPEHTWAPGGMLLPCCQRCTGLYAGALVAALLHAGCRPRLNGRFLSIHGLFLLQMVPFGYHWLPQGPVLRTITGVLFGFGVVTFLWLLPAARLARTESQSPIANEQEPDHAVRAYWICCCLTVLLVPAAAQWSGKAGAFVLSLLVSAGALTLAALILADAGAAGVTLVRLASRGKRT